MGATSVAEFCSLFSFLCSILSTIVCLFVLYLLAIVLSVNLFFLDLRNDIAEIFIKVALNTNQSINPTIYLLGFTAMASLNFS
jgi:hypothetical protein